MKHRTFYVLGLILSIVVFFVLALMPETTGDTQALIGVLSLLCAVVFLIAIIVSSIRAKNKRNAAPAPSAPTTPSPSVPTTPVPNMPTTPAPSVPTTPTPSVPTTPAPSVPTTPAPSVPTTPSPSASAPSYSATPSPSTATTNRVVKIERVHVRGVDHYGKNIESVGWENPDYSLTKRELQEDFEDERVYKYTFDVKANLVPDPDNEHDPNAIMVQANGLCIGHVPRGSTAHVRNLMESGRIKSMTLNIGGGKYKEVYDDGDGGYELDIGELKYSAVLELHITE